MTRLRAQFVSSKMMLRKAWQFDTPEECRERRRRRIEMRRARWSYLAVPDHHQHDSSDDQETCLLSEYVQQKQCKNNIDLNSYVEEEEDEIETETEVGRPTDHVVVVQPAVLVRRYLLHQNPMPKFGAISLVRRPDRVQIQINVDDFDAVFVKEDFCRLKFSGSQPMHYFAVYDGHGHPHVTTLCNQWMHHVVIEELRRVTDTEGGETGDGNKEQEKEVGEEKWPDLVRTALERSFQRMHRLAQDSCSCGNIGHTCGCKPNINALPVAGSTAVVAILTAQHIVVANCSSSHAVLGRDGSPFPPSHDQKPERLDEQRMRAVDGRIFNHNGVRVYGDLNMSHSPGPVVTLEPQISIIERQGDQDESLILANDGFWDVIPDDMACRVAGTCFRGGGRFNNPTAARNVVDEYCVDGLPSTDGVDVDESEMGAGFLSSKTNVASSVLCRLALARGSQSDMTLMVVHLKSG